MEREREGRWMEVGEVKRTTETEGGRQTELTKRSQARESGARIGQSGSSTPEH